MEHATISRGGEVSFPLWIKVVAWVIGICFPIMSAIGAWALLELISVKLTLAEMKPTLTYATEDRYRKQQAEDAHELIMLRVLRNAEDIEELQRVHGRAQD